ncbi:hypothetical protein AMTRI_Chr12g242160 [Amborella trichopoda]|uniref:Uncharacterized protein n=1 Tax=Amborella trichopoda TaxID=13333 RepID=U5D7M3_AMBTC|nr:hypothetical protein AMTR_s00197p00020770 [Amborella trichopoda]
MQTKNQVRLSYPFWSNVIVMLACCVGCHAEAFRHSPLQATISLHNRVLVSSCPALLNRVLVFSWLSIHQLCVLQGLYTSTTLDPPSQCLFACQGESDGGPYVLDRISSNQL